MQCKKALEEAAGDMDKALVILKKHAVSTAEKKADRELGAGVVEAYIHSNHEIGAMVDLLCETDFVAKNDEFVSLARELAMQVAATNPSGVTREDINPDSVKVAEEVYRKEAEKKPKEVQAKIIEGKLNSYFKEGVLLEQSYIKDPDRTIKDLIETATQKFGEKITVSRVARFSVRR